MNPSRSGGRRWRSVGRGTLRAGGISTPGSATATKEVRPRAAVGHGGEEKEEGVVVRAHQGRQIHQDHTGHTLIRWDIIIPMGTTLGDIREGPAGPAATIVMAFTPGRPRKTLRFACWGRTGPTPRAPPLTGPGVLGGEEYESRWAGIGHLGSARRRRLAQGRRSRRLVGP